MSERLNARIDLPLAKKVASLRRLTGQSTTDVVRTALERYHASVGGAARPYDQLVASGFIGCAEGPADLSSTYKAALTQSLESKLSPSPRKPRARKTR